MSSIYDLIEGHKRISIIGMEKNVGKTTVLNKIIKECKKRKEIAITSIGRDGEEQDLVTNTPKPRIYIYSGTIIATAKNALAHCDITREILEVTDCVTPMGEVVVVRALSDGYVDIAGPSYNEQILNIVKIMEKYGAELSLIDGALSRKGSAAAHVCDGTILATGAALSPNMNVVIEESANAVSSLTTQLYEGAEKELIISNLEKYRTLFVMDDGRIEGVDKSIFLESGEEVIPYLKKGIKTVVIKGAITEKGVDTFIKNRDLFKNVNVIAVDGTKFFISPLTKQKANLSGIKFYVLNKINLLFVTSNPTSPMGNNFHKGKFNELLKSRIQYKVIDVMEEEV